MLLQEREAPGAAASSGEWNRERREVMVRSEQNPHTWASMLWKGEVCKGANRGT